MARFVVTEPSNTSIIITTVVTCIDFGICAHALYTRPSIHSPSKMSVNGHRGSKKWGRKLPADDKYLLTSQIAQMIRHLSHMGYVGSVLKMAKGNLWNVEAFEEDFGALLFTRAVLESAAGAINIARNLERFWG